MQEGNPLLLPQQGVLRAKERRRVGLLAGPLGYLSERSVEQWGSRTWGE